MGSSDLKDFDKNRPASVKLRPVKDVMKKLRFDDRYLVEDYVVGFIERRAGIVEKKVRCTLTCAMFY